jgi:prophage tail gpP-like protein
VADVELVVDGQAYGGWRGISITRSLEQLADSFSLGFSDRWLQDAKPLPIVGGAACRVQYKGKPVINGYVVDDGVDYSDTTTSASVDGNSKTIDLVECSAASKTWRKAKLQEIADTLCKPFGISVSAADGVDLGSEFRSFCVEEGEKVFETLSRAAQLRGVLPTTDAKGNLVFTRAGLQRTSTVIERGVNAWRGARKGSLRDRFSEYTLKSQIAGDNEFNGDVAHNIKVTSKDDGVKRHRPLTIVSDTQESKKELQKRADWERNVRRGRSLRLTYSLHGWEHASGLWAPNLLVPVRDNKLAIDGEFLVVSVKLTRDDKAPITELELTAADAMTVEPPKKKAKGAGFVL